MYKPVRLNLTKPQARKLLSGKGLRVSPSIMGHGDYEYYLSPEQLKKMQSGYRIGKGMNLSMDQQQSEYTLKHGEGLPKWLKRAIVWAGKAGAKQGVQSFHNWYKPEASIADRALFNAASSEVIDQAIDRLSGDLYKDGEGFMNNKIKKIRNPSNIAEYGINEMFGTGSGRLKKYDLTGRGAMNPDLSLTGKKGLGISDSRVNHVGHGLKEDIMNLGRNPTKLIKPVFKGASDVGVDMMTGFNPIMGIPVKYAKNKLIDYSAKKVGLGSGATPFRGKSVMNADNYMRGYGVKKGTKEAKDKMAKIRAMKKGKGGVMRM